MDCTFSEKFDTVTKRVEFTQKVSNLEPRKECYALQLNERAVLYSVLSKTRVKAKRNDAQGKTLLAIRFIYDVK